MADGDVSGLVCAGGEGAVRAQVLALADDRLVAHTVAGDDGGFRLQLPDVASVRLLARCRVPVAGLAVGPVPPAGETALLRLEDVAPASPVIFAAAEPPAFADCQPFVRLAPLALGALSELDVSWAMRRVGDRSDSAYLAPAMESGRLTCRLQHGRWWFSADLVVVADTRVSGGQGETRLYAVEASRRDGRALEALRGGWALDVDGPAEVVVRLAPA